MTKKREPKPEPYSDCTLVNPLCPTDLCQLWYGHKGTDEHKHLLGTMPGSLPDSTNDPEDCVQEVSDVMFMAARGTKAQALMTKGWTRAAQLWPEAR